LCFGIQNSWECPEQAPRRLREHINCLPTSGCDNCPMPEAVWGFKTAQIATNAVLVWSRCKSWVLTPQNVLRRSTKGDTALTFHSNHRPCIGSLKLQLHPAEVLQATSDAPVESEWTFIEPTSPHFVFCCDLLPRTMYTCQTTDDRYTALALLLENAYIRGCC
jgi:hypothetical protein